MDKKFDLHKGGKPDIRESGSGFRHVAPKSPEISIHEKPDQTRDPLEFEGPVMKEKNYSRHLHKPAAAEAIQPRNPAEIESNEWRNFSQGKGGVNDIVDESAGQAGVHNFAPPAQANFDFLKSFPRGKKP